MYVIRTCLLRSPIILCFNSSIVTVLKVFNIFLGYVGKTDIDTFTDSYGGSKPNWPLEVVRNQKFELFLYSILEIYRKIKFFHTISKQLVFL